MTWQSIWYGGLFALGRAWWIISAVCQIGTLVLVGAVPYQIKSCQSLVKKMIKSSVFGGFRIVVSIAISKFIKSRLNQQLSSPRRSQASKYICWMVSIGILRCIFGLWNLCGSLPPSSCLGNMGGWGGDKFLTYYHASTFSCKKSLE